MRRPALFLEVNFNLFSSWPFSVIIVNKQLLQINDYLRIKLLFSQQVTF